jgi:hypothetical protein
MLTEEDQQRIKNEEIYRAEVQRQLKAPESEKIGSRLLRFFNTAFGVWILSSILLSGLTALYGKVQSDYAAKRHHELIVHQLGIRMYYGLMLFRNGKENLTNVSAGDDGADLKRTTYFSVLSALLDDSSATRLYPDFKDRSTLSLFLELYDLDHSPSDSGPQSLHACVETVAETMEARRKLETQSTYSRLSKEDQIKLLTLIEAKILAFDQMQIDKF